MNQQLQVADGETESHGYCLLLEDAHPVNRPRSDLRRMGVIRPASPDGNYLVTLSDAGWLKAWDAPSF
jgi:hypothetical protein